MTSSSSAGTVPPIQPKVNTLDDERTMCESANGTTQEIPMNDRDDVLRAKSDEIRALLHAWARDMHLLKPGEVIVFSMRIEERPLIERSPDDELPFGGISLGFEGSLRPGKDGPVKHIAPAKLTGDEVAQILSLFRGVELQTMQGLLTVRRNNPSDEYMSSSLRSSLNRTLRDHPISGKKYRISTNKGRFQLWEIE